MNKIIHRWGLFIISIILMGVFHFINEKVIPINFMLSNNSSDILKSTITFSSIISGFSGSLIGQLISSKNNKNAFIVWYFEAIDTTTFTINVMIGTISAFCLIGCSIILLSYDIMSDITKMLITHLWIWALMSFVLYQIKEYYLCLKILFFVPKEKTKFNHTSNINQEEKQNIFDSTSSNISDALSQTKPIKANSLIKKK